MFLPLKTTLPKTDPNLFDLLRSAVMRIKVHTVVTTIPLVLTNATSVVAQVMWARHSLASWTIAGDVMFAMTLESLALFLSYHAYLADKENDSAFRLRMSSYLLGMAVGCLNYSHFDGPHWKPTAVAIVVGSTSALSPWLWSVYSRRVSRNVMAFNGLIDGHSLRVGSARFLWHPVKSVALIRQSAWTGETKLTVAIAEYERRASAKKARKMERKVSSELETISGR
jgi:hypothetical protein